MTHMEIQDSIVRSISQLSLPQQLKLLDFINSLLVKKPEPKPEGLLRFAGILSKEDVAGLEPALKE